METGKRTLIVTSDGSHTVAVPDLDLTFHSRYGAIRESRHIFIAAGLEYVKAIFPEEPLRILEMGFGTGLNAFLTAIEAMAYTEPVRYSAIDAYPLEIATTAALNYPEYLGHEGLFNAIQHAPWNSCSAIHEHFTLC